MSSFIRIMGINSEFDSNTEVILKLEKILTSVVELKLDKKSDLDLFAAKIKLQKEYNINVSIKDILLTLDNICKKNYYSIDLSKISLTFWQLPF